MPPNEQATRANLIDPALEAAGWNLDDPQQVGREIPVDGYDATPWNGITDYSLTLPGGEVIAVVEAKKRSRNARDADEQLRHYVTEIGKRQGFAPFGFMSNGKTIHFWEVGAAHPRAVSGFFTREDLERLRFLRDQQIPLSSLDIAARIVDRPYQHQAVRRVAEAFEHDHRRRALMVMATGTGKTRVTMALIDLFLRARQAQHILFLADRETLVEQALTDGFKAHLPHEPRARIRTYDIDRTCRLYVATQQTMNLCYSQFSPGFFDLIVLDEAHRSIFNRLTEVLEYFDARMIGLTATPADFIDRDTFRVFGCQDKAPTFLYTFKEAVDEKWLVNFSLYQAQTGFQREGIHGASLSDEEKDALMEQGIDPDELDYSGTELEKTVSNRDTLRRQWAEIMKVALHDAAGLPGKTIVFAMTQDHAHRIRDAFEEVFPQYVDMAQVMTHRTERVHDGSYGDGLITKFKKHDLPRIAISVDMLDTGVDVPEVVNLVFMRPVQSRIKLWQMIGRGTRPHAACHFPERLPNGRKTEFKIIDFWDNDFERQADERTAPSLPVLVSLFNTRLKLLEVTLRRQQADECRRTIAAVRAQSAQIPTDSLVVKKEMDEIEAAWSDSFWTHLTPSDLKFLQIKVGPLLKWVPGVDVAATTFTHKVERLKLQIATTGASDETLQSIAEDVSRLPDFLHQNPHLQPEIKLCLSPDLRTATPPQLDAVAEKLAPEMKNRRERPSAFLELDLRDVIAHSGYISLGEGGEQVYVTEYKKRVESRVMDIVANHPTLASIRQGRPVSEFQLAALERALHRDLGDGDLMLSTSNIRKAYGVQVTSFLGFLRHLLDLDGLPDYATVVQRAFENHIAVHRYNADQIRFLRAVQSVFLKKRRLELSDLYDDASLAAFGSNAVERLFTAPEIQELLELAAKLAA